MMTFFLWEDKKVSIADALNKGVLDEHFPRSYLANLADQRPWTGTPSVTQLMNGTRYAYLKIVKDWGMNPNDGMWMLIGNTAHLRFEEATKTGLAEHRISNDYVTGKFDWLSVDDGALIDYKTYGSYKLMKILGIYSEDVPSPGPNGQAVFFKTGYKKGQMKTHKEYRQDADRAREERLDLRLQLNMYRILLSQNDMVEPQRLRAFITPRDGGTSGARSRGIENRPYYLDIAIIENVVIEQYFKGKATALLTCLELEDLPPICDEKECWEGRRCQGYCEVSEHCEGNPYIGGVA